MGTTGHESFFAHVAFRIPLCRSASRFQDSGVLCVVRGVTAVLTSCRDRLSCPVSVAQSLGTDPVRTAVSGRLGRDPLTASSVVLRGVPEWPARATRPRSPSQRPYSAWAMIDYRAEERGTALLRVQPRALVVALVEGRQRATKSTRSDLPRGEPLRRVRPTACPSLTARCPTPRPVRSPVAVASCYQR